MNTGTVGAASTTGPPTPLLLMLAPFEYIERLLVAASNVKSSTMTANILSEFINDGEAYMPAEGYYAGR
ncbi:MAG TPA: hypothetical protein VIC08_15490 [Cellvibrionaceae bacterium]